MTPKAGAGRAATYPNRRTRAHGRSGTRKRRNPAEGVLAAADTAAAAAEGDKAGREVAAEGGAARTLDVAAAAPDTARNRRIAERVGDARNRVRNLAQGIRTTFLYARINSENGWNVEEAIPRQIASWG